MKALIAAIALAAGLTGSEAAASWGYPGFELVAQAQKGRPDRGPHGREARPDRRGGDDHRRDRLNDDERRALHRDLDKANRELYQPRQK
jgi:hypothetical protein